MPEPQPQLQPQPQPPQSNICQRLKVGFVLLNEPERLAEKILRLKSDARTYHDAIRQMYPPASASASASASISASAFATFTSRELLRVKINALILAKQYLVLSKTPSLTLEIVNKSVEYFSVDSVGFPSPSLEKEDENKSTIYLLPTKQSIPNECIAGRQKFFEDLIKIKQYLDLEMYMRPITSEKLIELHVYHLLNEREEEEVTVRRWIQTNRNKHNLPSNKPLSLKDLQSLNTRFMETLNAPLGDIEGYFWSLPSNLNRLYKEAVDLNRLYKEAVDQCIPTKTKTKTKIKTKIKTKTETETETEIKNLERLQKDWFMQCSIYRANIKNQLKLKASKAGSNLETIAEETPEEEIAKLGC